MFKLLAPIAYMICIYSLSSISGTLNETPSSFVLSLLPDSLQNLLHIPLFGGLAYSFLWALNSFNINRKFLHTSIFITCVCYAAFDELHQMTVPGRYGSLSDIALDIIGILLVIAFSSYRAKRRA